MRGAARRLCSSRIGAAAGAGRSPLEPRGMRSRHGPPHSPVLFAENEWAVLLKILEIHAAAWYDICVAQLFSGMHAAGEKRH